MELPDLTQLVLLDRGMAGLVHAYLAGEQRSLLRRDPSQGQRLSTIEALSLAPVTRLLKRLATLAQRDQRPAPKKSRPHRLQVKCCEMACVRYFYPRMLASAAATPGSHLVLATALSRFHQPSLQLEGYIRLARPTFIGPQLDLC